MEKYTLEEIEEYLNKIGYSLIKTTLLEYLEEINLNRPG